MKIRELRELSPEGIVRITVDQDESFVAIEYEDGEIIEIHAYYNWQGVGLRVY